MLLCSDVQEEIAGLDEALQLMPALSDSISHQLIAALSSIREKFGFSTTARHPAKRSKRQSSSPAVKSGAVLSEAQVHTAHSSSITNGCTAGLDHAQCL